LRISIANSLMVLTSQRQAAGTQQAAQCLTTVRLALGQPKLGLNTERLMRFGMAMKQSSKKMTL